MANVLAAAQDPRLKAQTVARESRRTRGGRLLWYQLEVLQQPERARACGSGPKSSADRRPVDPPPVVILRVLEGETPDTARDITFDYNVDFFCYASLEHARPMAHGRVQTPAATSPPVLTGFPVSGCCYLDRPDPAGYFLFPDLSVRHEGRYRLVFSLYELIKEDQDRDADMSYQESDDSVGDACHRMDLKSADFVVYSAKKFPGLTESTTLSRTVAEQGCRVRIRRDVRMRRRDTKASTTNDFDNNAEDEYARRRRTQTPEAYRGRSVSNASMDRAVFPDQRRPSNVDYGVPTSSMYQPSQPSNNVLNFIDRPGNMQFAHPSFAPSQSLKAESTPVSPAQAVFPQNNLPPMSPGYPASSGYAPFDRSDAESTRRSSGAYPPLLSAKPSISYGPPSSAGSVTSLASFQQRLSPMPPMQPSMPSQMPSHVSSQMPSLTNMIPSPKTRPIERPLYPTSESRPVKRTADETFAPSWNERNVQGHRPDAYREQPVCDLFRRADGTFQGVDLPK
ncbi:velvet factor-domain-containing protein [Xylariomycetidae sp. FL0641]|nr:velvet factor-domain-containing protein [Xylariomycetidae sp. FL0641]